MEYLAVFIAAVAGFAVGAVWYSALGSQWMRAVGKTREEIQASTDKAPFIIAFIGALFAAGVMRHMFVSAEITGVFRSMGYGAGLGAFLVSPWIVLHYAFAGRPRSLWLIDSGHTILALGAIGAVLGFFY